MIERQRHVWIHAGVSIILSILMFTAGSRLLYADYRRTTTVTTTTAPTVTVEQPTMIRREVITTTAEPAVMVPATVSTRQVRDYVTFDLEAKKVFQSNENVRGYVIVNNTSQSNLSDSFTVKLYHNGKLIKELLTRMTQIPPGQSRFTFKEFGIPQINSSAAAQGNWTISIYDVDPAYSKEVDFKIIQSTNSNNLQR